MLIRTAFYASLLLLIGLLLAFPRDLGSRVAPEPVSTRAGDADASADPLAMARALAAGIHPDASAEEVFSGTCATCHGAAGEGNAELRTPAIGGLPDWFLAIQLNKFRSGLRGEGEGDTEGAQMAIIAAALEETQIPVIAQHVASFPLTATERTLPGDPSVGEPIFLESCAGCHRYNAHGEKAFRSAPLSSLQDWYLFDSMRKFRDEARGYHSQDVDGIFMHRNLKYFSDEDFENIVARIAELAAKYPPNERRPRNSRRYGDEPFAEPDPEFTFPDTPEAAEKQAPFQGDPFDAADSEASPDPAN